MSALLSIRKKLAISQSEMAAIANTTQATVSRWESGDLYPDLPQMTAIRSAALSREIVWNDAWFFTAGVETEAARTPSEAAA